MKRFVLNSAVITTPGTYVYRLVSVDEAKEWVSAGTFDSTIGYPETAVALSAITGICIPVNRHQIYMDTGDEALVFRLTCRMANPELKGKLTPAFVLNNCEIGILKKEK